MTELKPCPFCGSRSVVGYWCAFSCVKCTNCKAEGPLLEDHEAAIRAWNRSFPPVSEFASPYPTLTALLGPQLAEMERVCAMGQAGKYAGKRVDELDAAHHLRKAHGHLDAAVSYDMSELVRGAAPPPQFEMDEDTGAHHILLAAIRCMMADASAKGVE